MNERKARRAYQRAYGTLVGFAAVSRWIKPKTELTWNEADYQAAWEGPVSKLVKVIGELTNHSSVREFHQAAELAKELPALLDAITRGYQTGGPLGAKAYDDFFRMIEKICAVLEANSAGYQYRPWYRPWEHIGRR